jgi:glutathione synthase/RimK-type ligase-like ATP-grasp enzyme
LDFDVEFLCYNWLIRIQKNNVVKHIMGYDWEINSSTSQLIAKDKSACYETLILQQVPSVEHKLYLSPQFQNYIGENGSWKALLKYAESHNYKIVCKSNVGTGGNEVFKITNQLELETAVHMLFSKYRGICLCPYYDISTEYRVILLNGSIKLIYAKQKPQIIGNGKSTIIELIKEIYGIITFTDFDLSETDLLEILKDGAILELGWKHNLGKGAKPIIITESKLKNDLTELAISAAKAVNINFASVDIVECNSKLLVMEINSGVMTESFAQESVDNYNIAKSIYKSAMTEMLNNYIY